MKKILIMLVLYLSAYAAQAQTNLPPVFNIESDTADFIFNKAYVQVLPAESDELTIQKASSITFDSAFSFFEDYKKREKKQYNIYWLRVRVKNTLSIPVNLSLTTGASKADFYFIDSAGNIVNHYKTGELYTYRQRDGLKRAMSVPVTFAAGKTITIYYKRYNTVAGIPAGLEVTLQATSKLYQNVAKDYEQNYVGGQYFYLSAFFGFLLMAAIFNFFFFIVVKEVVYLYFSLFLLTFSLVDNNIIEEVFFQGHLFLSNLLSNILLLATFSLVQFVRYYFKTFQFVKKWDRFLVIISSLVCLLFIIAIALQTNISIDDSSIGQVTMVFIFLVIVVSLLATMVIMYRKARPGDNFFLLAVAPFIFSLFLLFILEIVAQFTGMQPTTGESALGIWIDDHGEIIIDVSVCWAATFFSWALFNRYSRQRREIAHQALEKERIAKEAEIERSRLIAGQKDELEKQVEMRTAELKQSLEELKATQKQLIQSEKMASLGELTAGIAHEIQNPLNFVNNFSEVSGELMEELEEERLKDEGVRDKDLENEILGDIKQNLAKINHHGKRADAIVKGMLQHSKTGSGVKEPVNINALADEFLRIAYHGFRSKDGAFNVEMVCHYAEGPLTINAVTADIGRVMLNVFNNAFYAVSKKAKTAGHDYTPEVLVTTLQAGSFVIITVKDNGTGIPDAVKGKIFQPFFTTKPTGEGTGLGLSLSYDIVVKGYNGKIDVDSKEGVFTEFTIKLPVQ